MTLPFHHPLSSRSSGVLLHPTSLPGKYGIGDLGPEAYRWVDALAAAGQSWWQLLPLGPTGYGDSPYQCFSAFAGNPNLISPELLVTDGLITADTIAAMELPGGVVRFSEVAAHKRRLITLAYATWRAGTASPDIADAWEQFRTQNADWLGDFALFLALKQAHGGGSWLDWPTTLRLRDTRALSEACASFADEIAIHQFAQFLFYRQWDALRAYAARQGVRIIGDMPIFLAEDSADVWANPTLFQLTTDRRPQFVAGVPPDYFSQTGQLWGNPLYRWSTHESTNFAWWTARLRAALRQVDLIRLDHFRGFEAYWEIPAGAPTAETGRWVKGPQAALLTALRDQLGGLPLIAEDLGVITPEVDALRLGFGLPGMRIVQFAFGGAVEERFLPHNYENPTVVYTGTHDNETTVGWYAHLGAKERDFLHRYLQTDGREPAWDLLRSAWSSVAVLAVVPVPDLLGLDNTARMNTPGRPSGNWGWRMSAPLPEPILARLGELTELYGRGTIRSHARDASDAAGRGDR
ncbi:MAG: 4-alpha-glucanotransferase [Bacteroidales bacterium]|nr:4-alpha-glucanotransferase [Bacteroidales bacterium]